MFTKIYKKIFIIIFFIIILMPLFYTNLKPNVVSKIENRNLTNFPKLYDVGGGINRNYILDFEKWFNDNVGFREFLFKMNSKIQYDIFNNSSIEKVTVGKDGWLFYTGEKNIEIATGEYPNLGERELKDICQKQIGLQKRLAELGIEYVLILLPSKVSIYPEYLKGNFSVTQTPIDVVADYLEGHSDIKVIRVKPALLEEKKHTNNLLYFKTDSHWNAYGCYIGYNEIINKLNEWGITDSVPAKVRFSENASMRDLTSMMVEEGEKYYETNISKYEVLNAEAAKITEGEIYDVIQYYVSNKAIRRGDYYENQNKDLLSFAVFGDSMFMDWLEPLMAENCSKLTCIWSYDITREAIDMINPDVVFLEATERTLNSLGSYSNELISSEVTIVDNNILDISYCDFGQYDKMWIPIWSEENGQDDMVWLEAERTDDWTWHVTAKLDDHCGNGKYYIHFYQGHTTKEEASYVFSTIYDAETLID